MFFAYIRLHLYNIPVSEHQSVSVISVSETQAVNACLWERVHGGTMAEKEED